MLARLALCASLLLLPWVWASSEARGAPSAGIGEEEYQTLSRAIELEDRGRMKRAIRLLKGLQRRFPEDPVVLHELSLAYRMNQQPGDAVRLLAPHLDILPVDTLAAYCSALDEAGLSAESEAATREAIERYPSSGLLYSTLGTTLVGAERYDEALAAYTAGMSAEVTWPSNYLRAAQIASWSDEPAMALVWGETFCHLEGGARCVDALVAMDKVYTEGISLKPTSSGELQVQTRLTRGPMQVEIGPDGPTTDLPHAIELALTIGGAVQAISPPSLRRVHGMRAGMLGFESKELGSLRDFDVELFQWLLALQAAGHLEAYDYMLFASLYPEESGRYQAENPAAVEAMLRYIERHPFTPTRPALATDRVRVGLPGVELP